jgi:formylglycine-generating enzyme required for sulfatase activity
VQTDRATVTLRAEAREAWMSATGRDRYGWWAEMRVAGVVQRFRWIAPGRFMMGSPEGEVGRYESEGPKREVTLTRGFWLGDTPVIQALWEAAVGNNPSKFKGGSRPVESVGYADLERFYARAMQLEGCSELRLPTEAEWEYACRAGSSTATWAEDLEILGENNAPLLDAIAWYSGNSGVGFDLDGGYDSSRWPNKQYPHTRAGTRVVRQKASNPWGLYDMLGNVWEWCSDWYGDYDGDAVCDPGGAMTSAYRVIRGGSWRYHAKLVRAASRRACHPGDRGDYLGFRLARGQ